MIIIMKSVTNLHTTILQVIEIASGYLHHKIIKTLKMSRPSLYHLIHILDKCKSNRKYTKSVTVSICCMVEGDSAEKFSSLRSDDCQAVCVKALIPVPFASGERSASTSQHC